MAQLEKENQGDPEAKTGNRAAPITEVSVPAWGLDVLVCLMMAGVGTWFVIQSRSLPPGRTTIDPGTFPTIIGGLLVVLALGQGLMSIMRRRQLGGVATMRPGFVAIAAVMILLFPTAMESLGYYITAAIWVPVFAWVAGMRSLSGIATMALVILGLAYFVFAKILGTPLS